MPKQGLEGAVTVAKQEAVASLPYEMRQQLLVLPAEKAEHKSVTRGEQPRTALELYRK